VAIGFSLVGGFLTDFGHLHNLFYRLGGDYLSGLRVQNRHQLIIVLSILTNRYEKLHYAGEVDKPFEEDILFPGIVG
jgi:hypothetical protein